jgi:hypothetical protein
MLRIDGPVQTAGQSMDEYDDGRGSFIENIRTSLIQIIDGVEQNASHASRALHRALHRVQSW